MMQTKQNQTQTIIKKSQYNIRVGIARSKIIVLGVIYNCSSFLRPTALPQWPFSLSRNSLRTNTHTHTHTHFSPSMLQHDGVQASCGRQRSRSGLFLCQEIVYEQTHTHTHFSPSMLQHDGVLTWIDKAGTTWTARARSRSRLPVDSQQAPSSPVVSQAVTTRTARARSWSGLPVGSFYIYAFPILCLSPIRDRAQRSHLRASYNKREC